MYLAFTAGRGPPEREPVNAKQLEAAKADNFMQFAVRDLIAKGIDEDHAWTVVLNTYGDDL